MGLDILVIPLHQYLAGEFTTAVERMFGEKYHRVGSPKAIMPKDEAVRVVDSWQCALRDGLKLNDIWVDAGEQVFSEQFHFDAWHALRAFAANIEYPEKFFRGSPHNHPALRRIWKGAHTRFKHLIVHEDNRGFYFPSSLPQPVPMQPKNGQFIAGSSMILLKELNELGPALDMTRDLGESKESEVISTADPLYNAKYGWAFMHHVARLSVQHSLPIVFDG